MHLGEKVSFTRPKRCQLHQESILTENTGDLPYCSLWTHLSGNRNVPGRVRSGLRTAFDGKCAPHRSSSWTVLSWWQIWVPLAREMESFGLNYYHGVRFFKVQPCSEDCSWELSRAFKLFHQLGFTWRISAGSTVLPHRNIVWHVLRGLLGGSHSPIHAGKDEARWTTVTQLDFLPASLLPSLPPCRVCSTAAWAPLRSRPSLWDWEFPGYTKFS